MTDAEMLAAVEKDYYLYMVEQWLWMFHYTMITESIKRNIPLTMVMHYASA